MSVENDAAVTSSRCASCGIEEQDAIKLKNCTACYLVRYCGIECQKQHRPKHKRECKRRAAELKDELLFKQPKGSHFGDCPICMIPLPIVSSKSNLNTCCSKFICKGCNIANQAREIMAKQERKCPFCRKLLPDTQEEADKLTMKRVEANDPVALRTLGTQCVDEGDFKGAFKYWTRAGELGDVEAHYKLSILYQLGQGDVEKDEKKEVYHLEQAAIGGHPEARNNLGAIEMDNGRYERALKHWMIATNLGCDLSLANLKRFYGRGIVSKDDFAAALRAHHAAVGATKSPQREAAEE